MKRSFILAFFVCFSISLFGQDLKVKTSIPTEIYVGEYFKIVYSVNNSTIDSFRLPKIKHLKLVSGPSKSSQSNTQIFGGKVLTTSSISLTYVAVIDKKGQITLPSASIWYKGKVYKSNSISIDVLEKSDAKEKENNSNKGNQLKEATADEISAEDLFVRSEFDNKVLYEGQNHTLTIKLYYRVNVNGWNNLHLSKLKNCDISDIPVKRNQMYGSTYVNGILYNTVILVKKQIKPLTIKTFKIEKGSVDVIVNLPNKNDFWGGYHKVNKSLVIPGLVLDVKSAKEKPIELNNDSNEQQRWNL